MSLPRLSLVLAGLVFAGLGAYFLLQPGQVVRLLGLPNPPAVLRAELTAVYGGLQLGLGVFFLVAASRGRWVLPALAAQAFVFAGLAFGRIVGAIAQGESGRYFPVLLPVELVGLLLGLLGYRRARHLMATNAARAYW